MRGIEGALAVWTELGAGGFASEIIRKKADLMKSGDLSLCSSLVYAALRKMPLWRDIYGRFLKNKVSERVENILLIGTAGLLELKHFESAPLVSALVNETKKIDPKSAALVNAVLRRVEDEGRKFLAKIKSSPRIEDKIMFAGVPKWVLPVWTKSWGNAGTLELLRTSLIRPYASLRVSDGEKIASIIQNLREKKLNAWQSPIIKNSIRISSTIFPAGLDGYKNGEFSQQTESSMLVGSLLSKFYRGGHVLDMCSGRGIKAFQFILESGAPIECWELSQNKTKAAEREAQRLGVAGKAIFKTGDALALEPEEKPSLILLDAPCSGSGTWTRHPESKWKMTRNILDNMAKSQSNLFSRALSLIGTGGVIIYSTCSLFREENEQVVAAALNANCQFLPVDAFIKGNFFKKGSPFGNYVLPTLPWLDGFYIAAVKK